MTNQYVRCQASFHSNGHNSNSYITPLSSIGNHGCLAILGSNSNNIAYVMNKTCQFLQYSKLLNAYCNICVRLLILISKIVSEWSKHLHESHIFWCINTLLDSWVNFIRIYTKHLFFIFRFLPFSNVLPNIHIRHHILHNQRFILHRLQQNNSLSQTLTQRRRKYSQRRQHVSLLNLRSLRV